MAVNPRIDDLRRRLESDPASIAFAQLAEEHRRAGDCEEAIRVCEAGLAQHPAYLSARVTLGRALIELGRLEEARAQFMLVVEAAPDNLIAIGKLAEIDGKTRPTGDVPRAHIVEPETVAAPLAVVPPQQTASDPVLVELETWLEVIGERRRGL